MSEEKKKSPDCCDIPAPPVQCVAMPERVSKPMRVGADHGSKRIMIELPNGAVIFLEKDNALTLGQIIIEAALKL